MRNGEGLIVRIQIKDAEGKVVGETDAVPFKGLLSLAHEDGLRSVKTKLLQRPSSENRWTAIVQSRVRTRRGTFSGIGDANPENVNPGVGVHAIRVAETRATARALRAAVNIGEVALEELAGNVTILRDAPRPADSPKTQPATANDNVSKREDTTSAAPKQSAPQHEQRRAMTDNQKKALFRLVYKLGATQQNARDKVLAALGEDRLEYATRECASAAIDKLQA